MSLTMIRYVVRAAVRDKLIIGLCFLLIMAVSLSVFMGAAALTEQDRFVAVFAAGSIRILNAFGLVLFVVFFIRRSFETRDIELMLSRPIGRIQLVLSYAAGFSILAVFLGVVSGVCVSALSPHLFSNGHILWTASLIVENILMVNVALFFSMILTSAPSCAFASLGFYVLSRMMSQILGIIDSGKSLLDIQIMETLMQVISALMPRLDLMAQTSWLVYGPDPRVGYSFILLQGIIYAGLILLAALIDLRRRQF
ncbi:MAG: hypothetical protein R3E13_00650 [Alphaproteobacteria bacterium]